MDFDWQSPVIVLAGIMLLLAIRYVCQRLSERWFLRHAEQLIAEEYARRKLEDPTYVPYTPAAPRDDRPGS